MTAIRDIPGVSEEAATYLETEPLQTELREKRVQESNHQKESDVTEKKLKIPGKIVAMSETQSTLESEGRLIITTETQVFTLQNSSGTYEPTLLFDITEYQDKPTEEEVKETKDKEAARKKRWIFLTEFLNVQLQVFREVCCTKGKNQKMLPPEFMSDVLRAIDALNAMDAEDAKS